MSAIWELERTEPDEEPPRSPKSRADRHRARRGGWRLRPLSVVVALVCVLGVVLLLVPTAANWFATSDHAERIVALNDDVEVIGPQQQTAQLDAARVYNDSLTGGAATVGAGQNVPFADRGDGAEYEQILAAAGGGTMARLVIPSIGVDLPIYHGTSDEVLLRGVGHLEGTSLPVGGSSTHAVLTAHRGLASAELFTHLDQVEVGETFTIQIYGEVLTYQVIERQVVEPDETQTLYPRQGEDLVTLVTCTPLGINSHRILVTAERVLPTPLDSLELASQPPAPAPFPWWALAIAGTVLAAGTYVYLTGRPRPSERSRPDTV
ncbi:class C sortase [Ruania rhizosphaerae]|uniref:class C sortase n=1 Tax=Ruania rhizosphaerae TaxID=1840413 RepID=UPI001F199318|nr:class C sortase [Ruania rhizosphaerae]